MLRGFKLALGVLGLLVLPRVAEAAGEIHLDWQRGDGAASCVSAVSLQGRVEARLGRSVFTAADDSELSLNGRVAREADGRWAVDLALQGPQGDSLGKRTLRARQPDCGALTDAIVLIVAMLIEAGAPSESSEDSLASLEQELQAQEKKLDAREAELDAREAELARREAALEARASRPSAWRAEALFGVSAGLVPEAGLGAELRLATDLPLNVSVEISAAATVPRSTDVAGGTTRYFVAAGALDVCPRLGRLGPVAWRACAGFQVGWLGARSEGFARNDAHDRWVANALASLRARIALLSRLELAVSAGLGVPTRRDTFFIRRGDGSRQDTHQPEAVYFQGAVGLGWQI